MEGKWRQLYLNNNKKCEKKKERSASICVDLELFKRSIARQTEICPGIITGVVSPQDED